MTQTVIDYAKEMKRLSVSNEDVKQTPDYFKNIIIRIAITKP